jgi:folate-binding protein YgfZ
MTSTESLCGALRLNDWGLIRAQGADAASFLHGQLTQDVLSLPADEARLAGFCSAKGRLLASFVLWRVDDQTIHLACSADLLAPTLKRLTMFVMRAKCKLSDASAEVSLYGLVGTEAQRWIGAATSATPWGVAPLGAGQRVRLPAVQDQPRFMLALPAESPAPALPLLPAASWQWLEVRSGMVRISAATVEHFVPQMVNLDLIGALSYTKGCYPGQEIVARTHYLGRLKQRMFLATVATPAAPGEKLYCADLGEQAAGMIVSAALNAEGHHEVLAVLQTANAQTTTYHCGSLQGAALTLIALPYQVN